MVSELLAELSRGFEQAGIPYMIIGGQAVLIYGRARFTEDVDVTIGVAPSRFQEISKIIARMRLVPVDVGMPVQEFVNASMLFPCVHTPSGMRVDIAFSILEYERQAIVRGRLVEVAGQNVRFAAPEDVVVMKMIAGRPRDVEDVKAIYLKNRNQLDLLYIRHWLTNYSAELAEPFIGDFNNLTRELDLKLEP